MKIPCEECVSWFEEEDLLYCYECGYDYCKHCIERHVGIGNCGVEIKDD